jgi:hypothetical protein
MVSYAKAIETIQRYLERTIPDEEKRIDLMLRVTELRVAGVQFLSCLLPFATDTAPVEGKVLHVTESVEALLDIFETDLADLRPMERKEIVQAITAIEPLGGDALRRRCIKTAYRAFHGADPDTAQTLVDTLEKISGGYLLFGELSVADAVLYRKLFILLTCVYARIMPPRRLALILQTQLLGLLLFMDIRLVPILGLNIWSFQMVYQRQSSSKDFAAALSLNHTALGRDAKGQEMEIEHWIEKTHNILSEKKDVGALREWLRTDKDVIRNGELIQAYVSELVLTYGALVSGYFVIEYHGRKDFESRLSAIEKEGASFPDLLKEHTKDFSAWIASSAAQQALLGWMKTQKDSLTAREALLGALQKAAPDALLEEKHIEAILHLDAFLEKNGFGGEKDLIFFNEKTGAFEWSTSAVGH